MLAVSNIVPVVLLTVLTGAVLAVFLRLSGFMLAVTGLLIAILGMWLAMPGHGPSLGQFIVVLISLQAGYLGGALLVAMRSTRPGRQMRSAQDRPAVSPPRAELE